MNKLIIAFIIVLISITGVILISKPELHKTVTFSQISTQIENIPEKNIEQETKIVHVQQTQETDTLQIKPQNSEFEKKQVKTKNIQPEQTHKTISNKQNTTTSQPAAEKQKYELPKSIRDIVNNNQPQNQVQEKNVKPTEPPAKEVQKPEPAPQKTPVVQNSKPLTEAEEIIVWNKWRSDLQNKVMRESRIAAPHGTVFRFSFTVNKFGQISNLKVWSDSPEYTNYAIQSLKPLLLSYQKQPILNFPQRTKRITTNVSGGFVVSNRDKYTTPNDYSDIERVRN